MTRIVFLTTALILLLACSSKGEKYEELKFVKENVSDVGRQVSLGINKLTFQFLKYIEAGSEGGSVFFSPTSVASSLAMLYFMTAGDTAKEISSSLSLPPDFSLGQGFYDLLDHLRQNNTMSLANNLFLSESFPMKTTFVETAQRHLKSESRSVDYQRPEEARTVINKWTEQNTGGKITQLLPPDSISPDTVLVLVSTVFFKGTWHYPFPEKSTKKRDFTLADGSKKKISMMRAQRRLGYNVLTNLEARVLHIPYQDGHQNFIIVLPDEHDGLPRLEEALITGNHLSDVFDISTYTKVKATIPKFKLQQSMELKGVLKKVGIMKVFDSYQADFSNAVDKEGLSVSFVHHSACIDIDEQGTEASAATGIGISMRAAFSLSGDVPEFTANHPFLFFITDSPTRAILFAGRFNSPGDSDADE